jgi:hypothetical protein
VVEERDEAIERDRSGEGGGGGTEEIAREPVATSTRDCFRLRKDLEPGAGRPICEKGEGRSVGRSEEKRGEEEDMGF